MTGFAFVLITAYCLVLILLHVGWFRSFLASRKKEELPSSTDSVAVVIPVRNEAQSIGQLLDDIMRQEYPASEVLVVNDHSEDNTEVKVKEKMSLFSSIRLLELKGEEGKKKALDFGIRSARSSIIVTIDADCRAETTWLKSIQKAFTSETVKMVTGAVRIQANGSLFSSLQAMEFSSLIGTGVATLQWGIPTMSNGANLAFRKDTFEAVDGYKGNFHIASGDDEFLMRKIAAKYPQGIKFNSDPQSIVTTGPQKDVKKFFHQRLRWSSKWRSNPVSIILAIFIFLVQVSIIILIISVFRKQSMLAGVSLLGFKMLLEAVFLKNVMAFLRIPWKWKIFISWQILYPVYAVVFGLLTNVRSYRWKDRKFR